MRGRGRKLGNGGVGDANFMVGVTVEAVDAAGWQHPCFCSSHTGVDREGTGPLYVTALPPEAPHRGGCSPCEVIFFFFLPKIHQLVDGTARI